MIPLKTTNCKYCGCELLDYHDVIFSHEIKCMENIISTLKQGDKVQFKWYGSTLLYTGRIEERDGTLYFVNESNYNGDLLVNEGMRYYNPLDSFGQFTFFARA